LDKVEARYQEKQDEADKAYSAWVSLSQLDIDDDALLAFLNLQRKNEVHEDDIEVMEAEKKKEREIARDAKKESDRLKIIAKKHETARDRVMNLYDKLKAAEARAYGHISADHFTAQDQGVSVSELFPTIHVGDALLSVNGRNCRGLPFEDIKEILLTAHTPHRCVFVEYLFQKDLIKGVWYSHQELRDQNKYVEDPFVRNFVFHQRVREGNMEEVRDLLRRRHDIDSTDYTGCTAFHFAASTANFEMMGFLIEKDANVNLADKNGLTPVLAAAMTGSQEVVEYLVENGAKLDIVDLAGQTPLYRAIQSRDTSLVNTLLSSGASIEVRENNWDWTPLHLSACEGLNPVVARLLDMGSNPYLLSRGGKSAKILAEANGHLSTAKLIQDYIFAEPAQCVMGGFDEGHARSFDSLKTTSNHFVAPGSKEKVVGPEAGVEVTSELDEAYENTIDKLVSNLKGEVWCGSSVAITQSWAKRQQFSKIYTFDTVDQPCSMGWAEKGERPVQHVKTTTKGTAWSDLVPHVKAIVDELEMDLCRSKGQKVHRKKPKSQLTSRVYP
jgi:hypothetical protein